MRLSAPVTTTFQLLLQLQTYPTTSTPNERPGLCLLHHTDIVLQSNNPERPNKPTHDRTITVG